MMRLGNVGSGMCAQGRAITLFLSRGYGCGSECHPGKPACSSHGSRGIDDGQTPSQNMRILLRSGRNLTLAPRTRAEHGATVPPFPGALARLFLELGVVWEWLLTWTLGFLPKALDLALKLQFFKFLIYFRLKVTEEYLLGTNSQRPTALSSGQG